MSCLPSARAFVALLVAATPAISMDFRVAIDPALHAEPLDGRLLLILSTDDEEEPRFQIGWDMTRTMQLFGVDVEGLAPGEPETLHVLGERLGIPDPERVIQAAAVKDALWDNTNEAIAADVFGVPTFVSGSEVFWGDDALPMLLDYLDDPGLFETPEMKRISSLPMGVVRTR